MLHHEVRPPREGLERQHEEEGAGHMVNATRQGERRLEATTVRERGRSQEVTPNLISEELSCRVLKRI